MAMILVIDDEESIRFTFERFLRGKGHTVLCAASCQEALTRLAECDPDVIVADIVLQDGLGIDILRETRQKAINAPVIMITGDPNVDTAMESVRLGAFDYLPKPVTEESLLRIIASALRYKNLFEEKERLRTNLEAIFRSVQDPIVTVALDGTVIEMNEAAKGFCGFSPADFGRPFKELASACNGWCTEHLEKVLSTGMRADAGRIECRMAGRSRVVSLSAYPLRGAQGRLSGAVLVLRDQTSLVDLENKLRDQTQFHRLVGGSPKMKQVFQIIEALAGTPTSVLIIGESGTGKELVAEALHAIRDLGAKPLVKVNCAALPESLLEDELFGHAKGAFTGAVQDRIGRFQLAHGGTIFFDEIGDMPLRTQSKLLRVLQEREFERIGESFPTRVDVRVLAATNKDLRALLRRGEFREDLYYRLKVVEIRLPPLRERREDIPLLIDHFLARFNKRFGKTVEGVSGDTLGTLLAHSWPGNVRELEHAIEHALVIGRSANAITLADLPDDIIAATGVKVPHSRTEAKDTFQEILAALDKAGWNKAKAARSLGIDRATLYRKMKTCKIPHSPPRE